MVQYVGRRTDGISLGKQITDTVSLYGVTPVAQPSGASQAAITDAGGGTANATTGVAVMTATMTSAIVANAFATVIAQTNAIRAALVSVGIIAGA